MRWAERGNSGFTTRRHIRVCAFLPQHVKRRINGLLSALHAAMHCEIATLRRTLPGFSLPPMRSCREAPFSLRGATVSAPYFRTIWLALGLRSLRQFRRARQVQVREASWIGVIEV
eukprot:3718062-Pleurochrysis_carterae.AAC.2